MLTITRPTLEWVCGLRQGVCREHGVTPLLTVLTNPHNFEGYGGACYWSVFNRSVFDVILLRFID